MNTPSQNSPSGFVLFLRGLLRLILVILIGLLIGAGLYVGGFYLYQRAVIPAQENALAIKNLNNSLAEQLTLQQEHDKTLEKRLASLESKQSEITNMFSDLQALQTSVEDGQTALHQQQSDLSAQINSLLKEVNALQKQQTSFKQDQQDLASALDNQNTDQLIAPLILDIQTMKVLQQINRAYLFLLQDNYGMAKQELVTANELLKVMAQNADTQQQDIVFVWIGRMDLAISHLPADPKLAQDDLEIIWSMLSQGFTENSTADAATLSNSALTPTITAVPTDEQQSNPTPTGTLPASPTSTATLPASPTPTPTP